MSLIIILCHFHFWIYLKIDVLYQYYQKLAYYVSQHFFVSAIYFCLAYMLVVMTLIPGGIILTILGGFLFGNWLATFLVLISASVGALILVVIIRMGFGEFIHNKMGHQVRFMEKAFRQNAFLYILSLRLLPIIPFFMINLAVGIFNIRLRDFFWGTFWGIAPATFIYANIGTNLAILIENNNLSISGVINGKMLWALFLLALLPLLSIFLKKFTRNIFDNT